MSAPTISNPTFEHHFNVLGVGTARPRISWHYCASEYTVQGWSQRSYEVEINLLPTNVVKTHQVESEECVLIPWPADDLKSRSRAQIRIRCLGGAKALHKNDLIVTNWSPQAVLEVGLLDPEDWIGGFITSLTRLGPAEPLQPLRFRKEFVLPKETIRVVQARLYITSFGVFIPYLNGVPVRDECMAPGWTSYNHRLNYRILDVSKYLSGDLNSRNVLAAEGGERWDIALLALLEVVVETQSGILTWKMATDDTWLCTASAIQSSEIYDDKVYDKRQEQEGWNEIASTSAADQFVATRMLQKPSAKLVAPDAPPVRVIDTIPAKGILKTNTGKLVIDFGQKLVGKIHMKMMRMPASGQKVSFRHAEVMEKGELGVRPLRSAKCTDTIISDGFPLKDWSVKFTFHGFRYVQIDGLNPSD